jgi:predicted DNA-binding transcriptional regulator AlpA
MDAALARKVVNGDVELMGVDEIVARLGVSRRTLERWVQTGKGLAGSIAASHVMHDLLDTAPSFPRPDLYIGNSPKWTKDSVTAWVIKSSKDR